MKSWQVSSGNIIENEVPTPVKQEGEIKVRIARAVMSSSDVNLYKNATSPTIPCRVGLGYAGEANEMSGIDVGTKVLLAPYQYSKDDKVLINGVDCDGYLRDFAVVNLDSVYTLPKEIREEDVYFIEYVALAINVINQINIDTGHYITLVGINRLSLLIAQLASYYQAIPILVDNSQEKINLAKDMGLDYTICPTTEDAVAHIYSLTGGNMSDFVVYSGSREVTADGMLSYAHDGSMIVLATASNNLNSNISLEVSKLIEKNLKVITVTEAHKDIPAAINALATGTVDTSHFDIQEISWTDVPEYIKNYDNYKQRKIVVNCDM